MRNLDKFENLIKIHFFICEIDANFNNFPGRSGRKSSYRLDVLHAFTSYLKQQDCIKKVFQNNFCNKVFVCTMIVCSFGDRNNAQL